MNACHEEFEVVTVFGDAKTALNEDAELEGEMIGVDVKGSGVVLMVDCCCLAKG